jgi:hypothetical protein
MTSTIKETSTNKQHIKLFVGCAPNGEDAETQMVLEHTARKHSSMPIDITWMKHETEGFWSGWKSETWATPFSGFRWGIPAACNYIGEAIYMDSDMIVLGDLAELWNAPWQDSSIIQMKGDWRTCVAKWNCQRAGQIIPNIEQIKSVSTSHNQLFTALTQRPHLQQTFDRQWNNFDGENDELHEIKILHYTDMASQMHLKRAIPRLQSEGRRHWYDGEVREHRRADVQELFDKYYQEALDSGMKVTDYYSLDSKDWIGYTKESQKDYKANNGFDGSQGQ